MNRPGMIAKIQIEFPKLRPDLDPQTDAKDLRAARLDFCRDALDMRMSPASLTILKDWQLKIVLDKLTEARTQQSSPNGSQMRVRKLKPKAGLTTVATTENSSSCGYYCDENVGHVDHGSPAPAEIIHLAGTEQTWAINRVFEYLDWNEDRRAKYILSRFGTDSAKRLKPYQAKSLLVQLLTMAAHRDLKLRGKEGPIGRDQTLAEIPNVKRRLGIDRAS
jgi:hypothetical protein